MSQLKSLETLRMSHLCPQRWAGKWINAIPHFHSINLSLFSLISHLQTSFPLLQWQTHLYAVLPPSSHCLAIVIISLLSSSLALFPQVGVTSTHLYHLHSETCNHLWKWFVGIYLLKTFSYSSLFPILTYDLSLYISNLLTKKAVDKPWRPFSTKQTNQEFHNILNTRSIFYSLNHAGALGFAPRWLELIWLQLPWHRGSPLSDLSTCSTPERGHTIPHISHSLPEALMMLSTLSPDPLGIHND